MSRDSRSGLRPLLVNLALLLIAFGLLGLSLWSNRDQIRSVLGRRLDVSAFAVAFLIYMIALVLTFLRWFILVRALELPFRVRDALRLGFIGNVFNLVIPGAVGGDVIKAAYLCREQARKTQAVASMVIDRALGLLGLFVLASVSGGIAYGKAGPDVQKLIAIIWATTAAGLAGLALIFTPALYRPLFALVPGHGRLTTFLHELVAMASTYRRRIGVVAAMLLMAMGIHSLFVLAFFMVSRALFPAEAASLLDHFLIVPLSLFSTAIPLPFGALGVSENITDGLFDLVGYRGGALAMMGFRVLMYGSGIISGLVYLANIRQVRELSHQVEGGAPALAPSEA